jgi:hypothetical protein
MTHKASRIYRVHLSSQGYTRGGAYYGHNGKNLYEVVITYKTEGNEYEPPDYRDLGARFRAKDYTEAKALVRNALDARPTSYAINCALSGERNYYTHPREVFLPSARQTA